jgi:hypothetical protein
LQWTKHLMIIDQSPQLEHLPQPIDSNVPM